MSSSQHFIVTVTCSELPITAEDIRQKVANAYGALAEVSVFPLVLDTDCPDC